MTIDMLLLLLSLICFVVGAFGSQRVNVDLIALGLAFWVTVPLLNAWRA